MAYPQILRVRQLCDVPPLADVPGEVHAQLGRLALERRIKPGQTVAVTAGSRGIANVAVILKAVVEHLRGLGARPFIVPAMGSHGGATAAGQRRVIESYGVSEEFCGCPIRAGMETVVVGQAPQGFPIHFDRHAAEADHVLVCGRVKPHTDFSGPIESGLLKMLLVGLGKQAGAAVLHRAFLDYGFDQIVRGVAPQVIKTCRVVAGLAIVENGWDQTARIAAVEPGEFFDREAELLELAKRWLLKLPFPQVDLLIVDEIGKDISGSGMDTNVIGRKFNDHEAVEGEFPKVKRIFVRGLSAATHGNGLGVGLAEFCTTRLLEQLDRQAMRINCLTSGHVSSGMLPFDYATDRAALDAALPTVGLVEPERAKVLWIRNTLLIRELECSAAYVEEARTRADLEIISPPRDLPFDGEGNLEGIPATA